MDITLSERVQRIKPSPTLAVSARASALKAAGKDIISLGAGEPDFDTPEHIKAAAQTAIAGGFTKYTPVEGLPDLRQAICKKLARDNNLHYDPKQILVSCGAKQSIYNLTQALLNPGDEAIIPAPYWVSYPDMVLLADATPVVIYAGIDQNYKITPKQLEQAITPKTRLFFMNSPSNPTGVAYTREELAAIGQVLLKHPNILILSDDIYEYILWTGSPFVNLLQACPELMDRTIVVNGVSKAYAMTGWRIGYAAGPLPLIQAMTNIQSQSTSNPTSISQIASIQALNGPQDEVSFMVEAFKKRHDFVYNRLTNMPGISCRPSDGTFYIFPNVEKAFSHLPDIQDDLQFSEYLLNEVGLALVPGSAFGAPGSVRISFATSLEILTAAMDRLEKALKKHG